MSTSYGIVGYPDIPRDRALAALKTCEDALRAAAWIEGENDPEAAYAPKGPCYRPGPAAGMPTCSYDLPGGKELKDINGVVFCGPKYINHGPFTIVPNFQCPVCGARMDGEAEAPEARTQMERCFERFGVYFASDDPSYEVACVSCEAQVDINVLVEDGAPTFVLTEVAVEFWDWTPNKIEGAAQVLDTAMGQEHRPGWIKV